MGSNNSRPSKANGPRATVNLPKSQRKSLTQRLAQVVLRSLLPTIPVLAPPPATRSHDAICLPPPPMVTAITPRLLSLSTHKLFPLEDPTTKEYQTITELIHPLKITSIERVVNPDLWERFIHARKEMLRANSDDLCLLSELGFSETEVMRRANLSLNFNKDPLLTSEAGRYSPNEVLLFHCTKSQKTLASILAQGLDERLSRISGALLGKGIYFSDSFNKSIQYDFTSGTILIFAVLLGDCLSVDHLANKDLWIREPPKLTGRQKRNFNDHYFDSITSRPDGEHNEYVIYNRNQCCPLYKVKYEEPEIALLEPENKYDKARKIRPTIAWRKVAGGSINLDLVPSMPNQTVDGEWPFFASTLFQKMRGDVVQQRVVAGTGIASSESSNDELGNEYKSSTSNSENSSAASICPALDLATVRVQEECQICFESPNNWKQLNCQHKLCPSCYDNIKTRGITMSGDQHTHIRCPFCQEISGTLVGTCPDGEMIVTTSSKHCEGYEGFKSFKIHYIINTETYSRYSVAYLPKTPGGKLILNLLRTAWDRRLIFSVGNSISTGTQNVLVWNIHHKTALMGGVLLHGYPDRGYLARVKSELKANGVKASDFISMSSWGRKIRVFINISEL